MVFCWLQRVFPLYMLSGLVLWVGLGLISPGFAQEATPDPMEEPSADASNAEELQLAAEPVLYLESNALWEDNFVTLRESFAALSKEMTALGLTSARPPLAVYLETDDAGFKFQAMLVLDAPPPPRQPLDSRMKFGLSPAGKALKFRHQAAFDELDSLYEAISGFLDEKMLTMKTPYIEEYPVPLVDPATRAFSVNIYVLIDESKPAPAAPEGLAPREPAPSPPEGAAPASPSPPDKPGAVPGVTAPLAPPPVQSPVLPIPALPETDLAPPSPAQPAPAPG
jgi:hypothetical protein